MTQKFASRRAWSGLRMLACLVSLAACSPEPSVAGPSSQIAAPAAPAARPAPIPALRAAFASGFAVNGILKPDRPLRHGDYLWNDEGVPAGPTAIVVDLTAQILYVYRGGTEIGRSAILYGADDKPTPTGTFPILEKDADHVSNLYGAPMPYMLRLTMDGVAIHGSDVIYGSGTHGCVGVPDAFAAMLFKIARIGDRVLVTKGWRTDVYGT